jgi:hypothetical protein
MQAPLHQHFAFGCMNELDALRRGFLAVRDVDDLEIRDIEAEFFCRIPDLGLRPDQDRPDNPGLCAIDRAA